jgi:hypothetical protein
MCVANFEHCVTDLVAGFSYAVQRYWLSMVVTVPMIYSVSRLSVVKTNYGIICGQVAGLKLWKFFSLYLFVRWVVPRMRY